MRNSLKAVLFSALSVVFATGAQAENHQHADMNAADSVASQPVISARGIVKDIDLNGKKITIAHEAIPSVGWPAMTMRFTFKNADTTITNLKSGSQVNFSFVQEGNISLLKSITATQS